MPPRSNAPLTDRLTGWFGRRLAGYPTAPVKGFLPLTTADPTAFTRALRPADVVLVEGATRVATAIKYLTQSTWSHSLLHVGPIAGRSEISGEPHALVEADVEAGVISAPISKYASAHTRICRPVGLSAADARAATGFAVDRIGLPYDLRNIVDLMRYLLPTPPVPARLRRRMIALGAGSPTRAICSTLIAQAFQAIDYPILPPIEAIEAAVAEGGAAAGARAAREIAHIRHYSLDTPRDFDISPYFAVVKPTIEAGFDYHAVRWGARFGSGGEFGRLSASVLRSHVPRRGFGRVMAAGAPADAAGDRVRGVRQFAQVDDDRAKRAKSAPGASPAAARGAIVKAFGRSPCS